MKRLKSAAEVNFIPVVVLVMVIGFLLLYAYDTIYQKIHGPYCTNDKQYI